MYVMILRCCIIMIYQKERSLCQGDFVCWYFFTVSDYVYVMCVYCILQVDQYYIVLFLVTDGRFIYLLIG